jgi:hypothetical protein
MFPGSSTGSRMSAAESNKTISIKLNHSRFADLKPYFWATLYSCLISPLFIGIDQPVCRRIVGSNYGVISQFRQYLIGQLFAQFHPPLIKAKNIPDNTLYKYFMLVHGYQGTQGERGQLL